MHRKRHTKCIRNAYKKTCNFMIGSSNFIRKYLKPKGFTEKGLHNQIITHMYKTQFISILLECHGYIKQLHKDINLGSTQVS